MTEPIFGERLKLGLAHAKMPQNALAQKMGKSRQYVYQLALHYKPPSRDMLEHIQSVSGINADYLDGTSEQIMLTPGK